MRVKKVEIFESAAGTLVRLESDTGLRGYGETARLSPEEAKFLEKSMAGADPATYEVIRVKMRGVPPAQAAANMALLDLLGKEAKAPIYSVLGGATRHKIRVVTTLGSDLKAQIRAGHKAFVVKVGDASGARAELVRVTAEKLNGLRQSGGEDIDFVLDGGGALAPAEAANLAAGLEKFHLLWFDEPCALANLGAVRKLARENVTPLGFGRTLSDPAMVPDLFREQVIDVLRLDVRMHGIAQIRRLAALAETYYTAVAPYHAGGLVATAAALQLGASMPNFFAQQVPGEMSDEIVSGLGTVKDGFVDLPTGPGLGIRVDDGAVERRYRRVKEVA